jgi:predicted ribosome quality control (RQC) complex YloA/Tae2 family protein
MNSKSSLKRKLKTSKKYQEKWEKCLSQCINWGEIFHLGELLQANLYQIQKGAKEISVSDWDDEGKERKISLDPLLSPSNAVKGYFKKAKKLKKGIPFAEKEVEKGRLAVEKWTTLLTVLEEDPDSDLLKDLFPPQEKKVQEKKSPPKPYWEFLSSAKIPIWVGKNAAMNDVLTFQYARGNDLWLHAADCPGSHVVIRSTQDQTIDDATFQLAFQLTLYYSKARDRKEGDIVMTQVKNVSRRGKEKGKVAIHHEKRIFCRLLLTSSEIQSSSSLKR